MYRIGVVSLFPELVRPVVEYGVVGRAHARGAFDLSFVSPRDFTTDPHRTVDDRPYGGGPGMVLRYEPMRDAIRSLRAKMPAGCQVLALSAQGRPWTQAMALGCSVQPGVVLVTGRYEAIDERVMGTHVDMEVSLGDYVLSGGELGAAVLIDSIVRLLPGVLGDDESLADDSFMRGLLGYPQYTRPECVDGLCVPDVLLGGNHAMVRRWRLKQALGRTWQRRPELLEGRALTQEERELLDEYRNDEFVTGSGKGMS